MLQALRGNYNQWTIQQNFLDTYSLHFLIKHFIQAYKSGYDELKEKCQVKYAN